MANNLYWLSALSYAVILLLILIDDIRTREKLTIVEKNYRTILMWVICFCFVDVIWGLCDSKIINSDIIYYGATTFIHLGSVLTTFFWLIYILDFLGVKAKKKNIMLFIDLAVIVFELVIVIINFFNPILFKIEDGKYVVGWARTITFVNQYIVYVLMGIGCFISFFKAKGKERDNYFTVFMFSLAPILLGAAQFLFPDAPFYSLAYTLACFVIHLFLVSKDRASSSKDNIVRAVASTFYSMHMIDIEKDVIEPLIQNDLLTNIVNGEKCASKAIEAAMVACCKEEYFDELMKFCDLQTLSERLENKNSVSYEFLGKFHGWTRASFIVVDREENVLKKAMFTTQIIDSEKRNLIDLYIKSNTDELTGLYNRRLFEHDIQKLREGPISDKLVIVSIDVNGLKKANDTLGHAAGDELLLGASKCMHDVFGPYGKVYRTGGDEFFALLHCNDQQYETIKRDFEEHEIKWKGNLVDSFNCSCGYVRKKEEYGATIDEMIKTSDERMYETKRKYYKTKGIDRRGQREAHTIICTTYAKILKIDLSNDTYQIINMNIDEHFENDLIDDHSSVWFKNFANSGLVHKDDIDDFIESTNIDRLRKYFDEGHKSLTLLYRRLVEGAYKKTMIELIPTDDYSKDNPTLFLYVKILED